MRPALLLLLACGGSMPMPDSGCGTACAMPEIDGGHDAGFMCEPGKQFCRVSVIWTCTFDGRNASYGGSCDEIAPGGAPWICSEQPCGAAGFDAGFSQAQVYCCH